MRPLVRRAALAAVAVAAAVVAAVAAPAPLAAQRAAPGPVPAEARTIARDAYVWGYPMIDMYAIMVRQALDSGSREFRAPLNRVGHARTVATPDDRAVIAPNVDTPYSFAWLDLRGGPVVLTLPAFEPGRYVAAQLFDLYTHIIGYVSPRTNGVRGGDFLVAGPGWTGATPPGIAGVFRSPTSLAHVLIRTQLLGPDDLPAVHALQDRYRVRTLDEWRGRPAPPPVPLPPRVPVVDLRARPADPASFDVLAWMLPFLPPLPEDRALRATFPRIGLVAGRPFVPDSATRAATVAGMQAALADMGARARTVRSSAELFGSREMLRGDRLVRATGAMLGILGNAAEEYLGIGYQADAEGRPFDGRTRYTITFAKDGLPPVGAFWSITVYGQDRLLYANPLRRYVINAPMLPRLRRNADGGITLYVQHDSPGPEREANWLPVPATPFVLTFRTYQPGAAIREGRWTAPPVVPQR